MRFAALFVIVWSLILSPAGGQNQAREVPVAIILVASEVEARQVVARLKGGEDFAALARDKSTDPTASQSGYMGMLDPAKLRPELRDALRGLAPGQLSAITRIPAGYAILRILAEAPRSSLSGPDPGRAQALTAKGAIRLTPEFSGYSEANFAFNRFQKPPGWDVNLDQTCAARTQSVDGAIGQLEAYLGGNLTPAVRVDANSLLANYHAFRGDMADAIHFWEIAYESSRVNSPEQTPLYEEALGVAHLHRAGFVLYDKFIFPVPLRADQVHPAQRADLDKAIGYFVLYLKHTPDATDIRWLLNLCYMLSGQYPGAVPKNFLIPPATFASKASIGRFNDVAAAAGLNRLGMAGGAIIDDFDNDGFPDVMVSSMNDCEPVRFFHSNGDGTFTDRAAQAGLSAQTGGLNMIQADYNNDGCLDFLILRGGWEYSRRKSLLRNNCDGTFTDVTRESGLLNPVTSTQTAVWVDIDNDGKLDLFLGNENTPSQLFHNNGNGTFTDISHASGLDRTGFTKGVVAADYDKDGYPDLYVSNFNGQHFLYHNNHNKTFTEVGREAGVGGDGQTFGAWFFDYDNDGWPDLFVAGFYSSLEDVAAGYLGLPQKGEPLKLYKNLGNGKFRDVTTEASLDHVFLPMGLNFGDPDNDGFLDFYLGSGNPSYAALVPNLLFHNEAGKRFTDVTASSGTGILPKGHGVAFADLDNDGDEDLFVVMGGAEPGDPHTARLFENPGNGNDWISVHLTGVKSNRSAIGAEIKVTVENEGRPARDINRTVGSGGSFGAGPFQQHIGLGKSAKILSLEVWWPASHTRQTFANVAKNQFIEIGETAGEPVTLKRPSFHLGKK